MIYLDMDGVIADFFRAFAKRNNVNHWKEIKDYKSALDDLKGTGFFFTIPKFTPLTDQIYLLVTQTAAQNNMEWGICSSPLAGDEHNSAYWKRRWLEDTEMMPKVKNLVFTANKHKYAETYGDGGPSILIDDKPANIHRWQAAGGIGIRFQANEDDFEYLKEELRTAIEIRDNRMLGSARGYS
jgi:hypothetical protein